MGKFRVASRHVGGSRGLAKMLSPTAVHLVIFAAFLFLAFVP
jgi:hypothetical protein